MAIEENKTSFLKLTNKVKKQIVSDRLRKNEYDESGAWSEGYDDDVRFPGPWDNKLSVNWTPWTSETTASQPLTIVVRLLGSADESSCDCNAACSTGFSCVNGSCVGDEGAGWATLGELVCTVADDGEFNLTPNMMSSLFEWVDPDDVAGAVLLVSRQRESTMTVDDALTYNGKPVDLSPIRTRVLDIIATRLEAP